ncbi:hypothetical protein PUR71_01175 [Streptomyces sp. SP17BM10]|nr:hypothetical protein [Streptomyces sp. SP17BM10]
MAEDHGSAKIRATAPVLTIHHSIGERAHAPHAPLDAFGLS